MSKEKSSWWVLAYLLAIVPNVYLWGFTFTCMWSWFLVESLRVHPISTWQAIGILMTIRYATIDWGKKMNTDTNKDFGVLLFRDTFTPLVFLGLGWVIKYFM